MLFFYFFATVHLQLFSEMNCCGIVRKTIKKTYSYRRVTSWSLVDVHDVCLADGAEHVVPDDGGPAQPHHLLTHALHVLQEQVPTQDHNYICQGYIVLYNYMCQEQVPTVYMCP